MKIAHTLKTGLWLLAIWILGISAARANLTVKVDDTRQAGSKSVVKLTLKNTFKEKVESARATLFLLDAQGKVVGQSTQWVIGGTKDKPALAPESSTSYNFVVEAPNAVATTKVIFNRIILEGGTVVDPEKSSAVTAK